MATRNPTLDPLDVARFWSRVEVGAASECWPWDIDNPDEYGEFRVRNGVFRVHRIAYALCIGPVDAVEVIRHKCDNPRCCNPSHLIAGDHADNVRDRVLRDRSAKGERNGRALLNEEAVRAIRASDRPAAELALQYGVSRYAIANIKARRSWTHIQ